MAQAWRWSRPTGGQCRRPATGHRLGERAPGQPRRRFRQARMRFGKIRWQGSDRAATRPGGSGWWGPRLGCG